MKKYIIKRTLLLLFLLATVSTIVFFLIHLVPGDPLTNALGPGASREDIDRVRRELNLDKPIFHQYLEFIKNTDYYPWKAILRILVMIVELDMDKRKRSSQETGLTREEFNVIMNQCFDRRFARQSEKRGRIRE